MGYDPYAYMPGAMGNQTPPAAQGQVPGSNLPGGGFTNANTASNYLPTVQAPNIPYSPGMPPGMMGMAMMMPPQGPQQGSPNFSMENYANQLQQMMGPYRQQAQQFSSPYATFGPGNQFAANHPRAAGAIDNALLAASMTKPSNTIGEGIANAAGGIVGAQQWHRQNAIQQAMLPYQLAEPGFNMLGKLSEMEMNQMYKQQMMDYHMGMMGLGQERVDTGIQRANDYTKRTEKIDNAPPPNPLGNSTFAKAWVADPSNAPQGPNGSYTPDQLAGYLKDNIAFQNAITGGKAGATSGANEPAQQATALYLAAKTYNPYGPRPKDPTGDQKYLMKPSDAAQLAQDQKTWDANQANLSAARSKWTASGVARQGVDFPTYLQQQGIASQSTLTGNPANPNITVKGPTPGGAKSNDPLGLF